MLKIGDFSKLSRISIRMLRHYDEIGLLVPESIDPFTGYRYYSEQQLIDAGRVNALREMGFGLAAIGEMMRQYHNPDALTRFLSQRLAQARAQADEAAQRVLLLETAIQRLRKDDTIMEHNVTVKTLPARQVASVRMTIPSYDHEAMAWSILASETAPLHLQQDDPCYSSVTYLDGEYKESDIDIEAQKTVKGSYPDTEHVRFKTAPPVTFASATFKGPYSKIVEANAAVAAWIQDNGYEYDGLFFNIYHVTPHDTQNPEEFVTEVCYPIRKK